MERKTPPDIQHLIEKAVISGRWERDVLRRGRHKGMGIVLREINVRGNYTGRMIQWHPGGGRHGLHPYWKVSSPLAGTIRLGPQFK